MERLEEMWRNFGLNIAIKPNAPPTKSIDRRGVGTTAGSHEAAALNDAKHYDDEGDHEQDVDETAHGVSADQTKKPQNDQDGGDGFKHTVPFQYVEQEGGGPGAPRSLSCHGDDLITNSEHTAGIRSSVPERSYLP